MAKKNFNELLAKMPAESVKRVREKATKDLQELALNELREARHMTQTNLARVLKVNQAAISKLENRTDMYVGTLKSYVQAMGGELRIEAVFPDGKVLINQFEEIGKAMAAAK